MADKVERRLAATLSADVVGYSRLMGADEEGTLARLKAHRSKLIDLQFSAHRGRIVKLMGDGVLVEFASVVDAVRCAAAIQRGMAARNETEDEDRRIVLRIGINLSDIIVEGDDIHGDGVNVAARMEQLAEPGGICISSDAFRQARGKVELGFADLGEQQLKNIAEPVRAYRVLMEAEAAVTLEPGGAGVAAIYSMVLVQSGRPEEAIEWFNRSKRLDPYISPRMSWTLAEALRLLGRYDEMIEVSKLILQTTAHWLERPRLIYAYMKQGREEEARTHLQMMLAGYPERVQAWLDAMSPLPTPMYEESVGVLREAGFPDPDNPAQLESEEFSVLPRSEYARAFSKNTES